MRKVIWLLSALILGFIGCRSPETVSIPEGFPEDIIGQAKARCINLRVTVQGETGLISAVIIDSSRILTAKHCLEEERGRPYDAWVVWDERDWPVRRIPCQLLDDFDLALIEVENLKFPVSPLMPRETIAPGTPIFGFNSISSGQPLPYF